ncbi:MAG: glycosyltransferase family 2 protein [Thermoanaerobaculia bacterium]
MEITYIIPTCGLGRVEETIFSILNQKIKPFELILIQNGIKLKNLAGARSIYLKKNYGYAKAINLGAMHSRSKYVSFINDDIYLEKNWAEEILKEFEKDPSLGACASFIKREDASFQVGSVEFNKYFEAIEMPYFKEGNLLNFAAVMVSKDAINKTGLLEEKFFAYYEDIDYSLRLMKGGFKLKVVEKAFATHKESSSSKILGKKREFYIFRNKHYTILRNFGFNFYLKNFLKIFRGDLKILKKNPHFFFYYPFFLFYPKI